MVKYMLYLLTFFVCTWSILLFGAEPPKQNQPKQNQPKYPRIAYFYPAGGQTGTTFRVLVGGRQITKSNTVIILGKGVRGRVVHDVMSLHINDPNERQLINKIYLEALGKAEGRTFIPRVRKIAKRYPAQSNWKRKIANRRKNTLCKNIRLWIR